MTNESSSQRYQVLEDIQKIFSSILLSQNLLCKVGYCLLLFSLFDFLSIIYPPQFTDPFWELGFIQTTIDRVVVPIIGFALIFINGPINRGKYERTLVRILSWLALLIFLSCIPLTALTISSVVRIDRQNGQQLARQKRQSLTELQAIQQELSNINSAEELTGFIKQFQSDDQSLEVDADQYLDVKKEMSESLSEQTNQIEKSNSSDRNEQRKALLKQTIRVLIGLFITGAAFFSIWKETKWARLPPEYFAQGKPVESSAGQAD